MSDVDTHDSPPPLPPDLNPAVLSLLRQLLTLPAAEVERIRLAATPRRREPGQNGPTIDLGEE